MSLFNYWTRKIPNVFALIVFIMFGVIICVLRAETTDIDQQKELTSNNYPLSGKHLRIIPRDVGLNLRFKNSNFFYSQISIEFLYHMVEPSGNIYSTRSIDRRYHRRHWLSCTHSGHVCRESQFYVRNKYSFNNLINYC